MSLDNVVDTGVISEVAVSDNAGGLNSGVYWRHIKLGTYKYIDYGGKKRVMTPEMVKTKYDHFEWLSGKRLFHEADSEEYEECFPHAWYDSVISTLIKENEVKDPSFVADLKNHQEQRKQRYLNECIGLGKYRVRGRSPRKKN